MKPTTKEQTHHVAKCHDCDWAIDDPEVLPRAADHAEETDHYVSVQTRYYYEYNGDAE